MQTSHFKTLAFCACIALPGAYLIMTLNYAAFQLIPVSSAFKNIASQPSFGQAYSYNFIALFAALFGLSLLLRLKPTTIKSEAGASYSADDSGREQGTVKWFNVSKGFGFISRTNGEDVFVHYRSIRGEGHRKLMEGQSVEFIVTQGEKGLQAEDVIPAAK